jgi:hypothetical protein
LSLFENNALKRIFGQVIRDRRKLQNEELHNLYFSLNIIWVIKLGILGWAGHTAYGRHEKCIQHFRLKPEGTKQLGRLDVGYRIILKEVGCGMWTVFVWFGIWTFGGIWRTG